MKIKKSQLVKLISGAKLEDELVRNFKNRNFLQNYGRL